MLIDQRIRTVWWMGYCAIALVLSGVGGIEFTQAQGQIELVCGEAHLSSPSTDIPGFVGQYFYVAEWGQGDDDARELGIITARGEQHIPVTLPPDVARSIGGVFVSPDGSKIAFPPFSLRSRNLVIWDRITNETASIELSQELADYLSDRDEHPDLAIVNFNQVVWHNSSELWIQYFGLYPDIRNPLLQIRITIMENPLHIVSSIDMSTIHLEAIQTQAFASPPTTDITFLDSDYRVEDSESSTGLYTRQFQVYDARTDQVVFEVQSSEEARVVGDLMWSSDRNHIFYVESVPSGTRLVQLNANERFQRDTRLDTLLQNEFGSSTGVSSTFPPILSRDGTHLAFGYIDQTTNDYYMVRYHPDSGDVVVVCDDFPTSSDWYPFWSPSNRFAGYWYSGVVKIYDFETGNRYLLPGRSFAGWVP